MGANYLTDPLILLIDSVASLYILAVMLRFLLQWFGVSFYNPAAQFLLTITHPPLRLLRRVIPAIGKIDSASLVLLLVLQVLENFSVFLLNGHLLNLGALTLLALADLIALLLNIFVFAVFARALLSWIKPNAYDAMSGMLISLTEPLLNIFRKFIPDLGGIDISPLAALLFLQLAKMIVLPPLQQLASLIS